MKVEDYLVKSNKPAMVIIISKSELIDDPTSGKPLVEILPPPGKEVPHTETPFPSRRKKNHQKKKRRNLEESGAPFQKAAKKPKLSRKEMRRKCFSAPPKAEKVFEPTHRLIPAAKAAKTAVSTVEATMK
ncbi:unnamed protein product [Mesocestoides corti]|nr:unnamed protein product [Mesocestoides corti]